MILKDKLQLSTQFLKKLKIQIIKPLPNEVEYALFFSNDTITTGLLNNSTEMSIDLKHNRFVWDTEAFSRALNLQDESISKDLMKLIEGSNLKKPEIEFPVIPLTEIENYLPFARRTKDLLKKLRYTLSGKISQIHLWGHNFDQDFVFYYEEKTDGNAHQQSIGFSPGDSFMREPYLYLNSWPFNKEKLNILPPAGEWVEYSENRYGLIAKWSILENQSDDEIVGMMKRLWKIQSKNRNQDL